MAAETPGGSAQYPTTERLARADAVAVPLRLVAAYWQPLLIFAVTFVVYLLTANPPDAYDHQEYLAKAMLNGTFDVNAVGIPGWYQDMVKVGDSLYLPYGPGPAFLLMPFVAIWGTGFSQAYFSIFLGALNVVLFWYVLKELGVTRTTQLLMVAFFAFGTVHFYSAIAGTLWNFNHVAAVFYLLIAVLLALKRVPVFLPAIALGFAYMSRGPTLLAAAFFVFYIIRQRHPDFGLFAPRSWLQAIDRKTVGQVALFAAALIPFGLFTLWYNEVRFNDPFDSGFRTVYENYIASGTPYSFYRRNPIDVAHYGMFDIRNVPLGLYTLFLAPPAYHPDWSVLQPDAYGMSVLLTSPAFIYAFFVRQDHVLKGPCWLAISLISIPLLTHFSQGWYQYGYRFLLDFSPFLLILTALGIDDYRSRPARRLQFALIAVSAVASVWGAYWLLGRDNIFLRLV